MREWEQWKSSGSSVGAVYFWDGPRRRAPLGARRRGPRPPLAHGRRPRKVRDVTLLSHCYHIAIVVIQEDTDSVYVCRHSVIERDRV